MFALLKAKKIRHKKNRENFCQNFFDNNEKSKICNNNFEKNVNVMMQDQKVCSIAQSLSNHRHVIACSFRLILNSRFALEIFLFSSSFVLYNI